jgi:hypothetical protein
VKREEGFAAGPVEVSTSEDAQELLDFCGLQGLIGYIAHHFNEGSAVERCVIFVLTCHIESPQM